MTMLPCWNTLIQLDSSDMSTAVALGRLSVMPAAAAWRVP